MSVAIPLQFHWAISAISEDDRNRAVELINRYKSQQKTEFRTALTENDEELLDRLALAYEMAALEGLDALIHPDKSNNALREQALAASGYAFDIRCLTGIPEDVEERIFHVLQLFALACCSDRQSDLQIRFKENESAVAISAAADDPWDRQLLYRLFECWTLPFRKEGRNYPDRIREIIAGLRKDQRLHEKTYLESGSAWENQINALRLVALYHWTKATELLAKYMLQEQPRIVPSDLDKHFKSSIKAAIASGDARYEVILRWLHAAGRIMVTNSR